MSLESEIQSARNPIEKARDVIADHSADLTLSKARKLFEAPFAKTLEELDQSVQDVLISLSLEEAGASSGKIIWGSAFNSYAALLQLVEAIRKPGPYKESAPSSYADEVMAAGNPLAASFAVFRKHKDMARNDAKSILELVHANALAGLSSDAREAVFTYAADRGVTWLEIAQQYDNAVDVVRSVKRPLYADL